MELDCFQQILIKQCGLNTKKPLLIGFSGGPDSLTLLDLVTRSGFQVFAAHFDHHLRPGSENEAEAARKVASGLKCTFVLGVGDVSQLASVNHRSVEEQARISRYQFLFSKAKEFTCQAVLVGHTADDQVETILMHFLRGSGLHGLVGMKMVSTCHEWDQSIPLIRPLLSVSRKEIETYCEEHNLKPIHDPSNQEPIYTRNKIRKELLPRLESYNPAIRSHLQNLSLITQEHMAMLDNQVDSVFPNLVKLRNSQEFMVDRQGFLAQEKPIQQEIIRRIFWKMRPKQRDLDFSPVERLIDFLCSPVGFGMMDWVAGIKILFNERTLFFYQGDALPMDDHLPQINSEEMRWDLKAPVPFENGWRISGEIIPFSTSIKRKKDFRSKDHAWFDADLIHFPLVIRRWKAGDKFQPLGMHSGNQKLSNFWINEQIPRNARQYYPVLTSEEDILWIPGLRTSQIARLTSRTKRVCHLVLENVNC